MDNSAMISVIVVEDSQFFADLAVRILKRSGLNIKSRIVSSRLALQKVLKEEMCDIILSDNIMPGFSALGALEIKNNISRKIPFVIVSEDVSQTELEEAFEKGCDYYLPKDRITDLPGVVRKVLNDLESKT